ncbi:GTS1 (YGL181W) [Zygosaccharomyces parabailii]|nr:GTS1 (YGL181W) [Zygosaccharomyces parabailii]CDH14407.1 related to ADP-ribosylation factor GTPase-activating protein effector protein 2 [Zygosaccharomyces bailii ISA1307]
MSSPKVKKALCGLLRDPGNSNCADCKAASHPRWASWSLGVFVCIKCAGVHRSLGTHISKVKSVDLDIWKEEHLVVLVKMRSNVEANKRYEARLPESLRRPITDSSKLQSFIRSKYEAKKWLGEPDEAPREESSSRESSLGEAGPKQEDELVPIGRESTDRSDSSSILNLQLLSMPKVKESSAAGSAGTAAVRSDRPDLKKSILSLYAKPHNQSQTQLQHAQAQAQAQARTQAQAQVRPQAQLQPQPQLQAQSLEDNELFKNVWT